MVIAIDGPAASGKGTLARRIAAHLGRPHLDTGLLYRAVALALLDRGLPLTDSAGAARIAEALDVATLEEDRLRSREIGEAASLVSVHPGVRGALLDLQRRFAAQPGGAVLDGRDIGTVVCPEAEVKIYVTASPEERARRRFRELAGRGEPTTFDDILADILRRDTRDSERSAAPMRPAADARHLDTTSLDADAAFARALDMLPAGVA
ncbi:(d)CMP kinase [Enterovirga rhinocerotis]|uniref:Cytidylate kinase n=1 Tax=Enterovirga rhinocerotis TaxID=1339210 RepID=A0A4R7BLJ1_9HYPH|nr:(d)CMP kinase [Enterovirga rhinocerotis]TDR85512.1 cytidylate kinase [Enterovirga rhinocerotis]